MFKRIVFVILFLLTGNKNIEFLEVIDWMNNNPAYDIADTKYWNSFEYYDYGEDGNPTTFRYIKGVHFHVPHTFIVFYQLEERTSTICTMDGCFSDTVFVASPEQLSGYNYGNGRPLMLENSVYFRINAKDNIDNLTVDDLDFSGYSEEILVDEERAILTHRCWNNHGSVCLIDVHVPLEDWYYIFSTGIQFTEQNVEIFKLFLSTVEFE